MVCIRCEMVVKSEFEKLGIDTLSVKIGEVVVKKPLNDEQIKLIDFELQKYGLELLDDKKSLLVEKIKNLIIELVHYTEDQIKINLSDFLSEKLNYDYTYLANLFSEVKGTNIEQFFIAHRIERVKELLVYDELSLTEIAYRLHFSSVAHLSNQFKKITGLTPTFFKKMKNKRRIGLDTF